MSPLLQIERPGLGKAKYKDLHTDKPSGKLSHGLVFLHSCFPIPHPPLRSLLPLGYIKHISSFSKLPAVTSALLATARHTLSWTTQGYARVTGPGTPLITTHPLGCFSSSPTPGQDPTALITPSQALGSQGQCPGLQRLLKVFRLASPNLSPNLTCSFPPKPQHRVWPQFPLRCPQAPRTGCGSSSRVTSYTFHGNHLLIC